MYMVNLVSCTEYEIYNTIHAVTSRTQRNEPVLCYIYVLSLQTTVLYRYSLEQLNFIPLSILFHYNKVRQILPTFIEAESQGESIYKGLSLI